VDLRKGFEALSWLVENVFLETPTGGAYFVFINKPRDRMKILYWDSDGLAIWYKRLEKGAFGSTNEGKLLVDRREFFMLLEGITPKKINTRYSLS
jgi:transposase